MRMRTPKDTRSRARERREEGKKLHSLQTADQQFNSVFIILFLIFILSLLLQPCWAELLPLSSAEPSLGRLPSPADPWWLSTKLWLPKMPEVLVDTLPLTTPSMKMPLSTMLSKSSPPSTLEPLLSQTNLVSCQYLFDLLLLKVLCH